jgi:pimeloyl-ACP methyl ester carboxylesterase
MSEKLSRDLRRGGVGRAWHAVPLFATLSACGGDGGAAPERGTAGTGGALRDTVETNEGVDAPNPADLGGSIGDGAANSGGESAPTPEATPLDESSLPGEMAGNGDPSLDESPAPDDPALAEPRLGEEASGSWPLPVLQWSPCQNGFECAVASLPRDYADPNGPRYGVAVTRRRARDLDRRIGPLFFNFGGPGAGAAAAVRAGAGGRFAALNERFDLVGFDPRGTGQSEGAIDCGVDQETEGLYAQPFLTPLEFDVEFWAERAQRYVDACVRENEAVIRVAATANVARDMELLRLALGDEPLSYLGFSYGTFLGATYAALFPHRYRALVLDAAVDADAYINRPSQELRAQSAAFELALGRFFEACAGDPAACRGFGGDDPRLAYDRLVADATLSPLPVAGSDRPLDGDDILFATTLLLYSKASWNTLAAALSALEDGNPTLLRELTDSAYGRNDDGTFDPASDSYFVLGAAEQTYASDPQTFITGGESAWAQFEHFFLNTGYSELPYGLFPIQSAGVFRGPFVASPDAPPILVVGTTHDPATPYQSAVALVEQLGNARLLTMEGDGHGAYGGNSSCVDGAVDAYLEEGTLPELGTECVQRVLFGSGTDADGTSAASRFVAAPVRDFRGAPPAPLVTVTYRGRPFAF